MFARRHCSHLPVEVTGLAWRTLHAARELRVRADARRTRWLERRGYRVVRVSARSVAHELESVLGVLARALMQS